ncbi:MAG: hypothetical protein M1838_000375 [Thelocarpon superellum]|nr:MAG: hypothetical protein M1838_000375 [Thelocarpon superellum]
MDEVTPQSAQGHPVPALLEDIAAQGKAWLQDDPQARKLLISRARSLITALETPPEAVIRLCWAEPAGYSAARTAVAMGLFDKVADRPSVPKSSAQLAAMIGAEARLVSTRIASAAARAADTTQGQANVG